MSHLRQLHRHGHSAGTLLVWLWTSALYLQVLGVLKAIFEGVVAILLVEFAISVQTFCAVTSAKPIQCLSSCFGPF